MYHVGSLDRLQKSTLYVKQIYPKYIHLQMTMRNEYL